MFAWAILFQMVRVLADVAHIGLVGTVAGPMTKEAARIARLVGRCLARTTFPTKFPLEESIHLGLGDMVRRDELIGDEEASALPATEILRLEFLLEVSSSEPLARTNATFGSLVASLGRTTAQ